MGGKNLEDAKFLKLEIKYHCWIDNFFSKTLTETLLSRLRSPYMKVYYIDIVFCCLFKFSTRTQWTSSIVLISKCLSCFHPLLFFID